MSGDQLDAVAAFLARLTELLKEERAADIERTSLLLTNCSPRLLEKKGLALGGLSVANVSIGLGGKSLVELERPLAYNTSQIFPSHSFRTGDIAKIEENVAKVVGRKGKNKNDEVIQSREAEGIVYRVTDTRITISVDAEPNDGLDLPERCCLIKLANSVTYDRMDKVIETLEYMLNLKPHPNPKELPVINNLHRVLLGLSPLSPAPSEEEEINWFDGSLNESQREAVKFSLSATEIACIWGPPGTGKTHTLIEIILQLLSRGLRVLVCGASNLAVDNILERLASLQSRPLLRPLPKLRPLRMSNPARTLASLFTTTLDYQVKHSEGAELVRDCKEELESKIARLTGKSPATSKSKSGKVRMSKEERRRGWEEVRDLRKEYRKREAAVVRDAVKSANVVLATCHSAGSRELRNERFDVLIIDEATQAMEPVCWIPILKSSKLILAGDPMQLPPTVLSDDARKARKPGEGKQNAIRNSESDSDGAHELDKSPGALQPPHSLSCTLFRRLERAYGKRIQRMLQIQYRMNSKIVAFPSQTLYVSKLKTDDSVKDRSLAAHAKASVDKADQVLQPLVFIDTAGMEYFERIDSEAGEGDEGSKSNENEASLVVRWVRGLIDAGLTQDMITVLTPYQAQVQLLCTLLRPQYPTIEIGTVDGMQGREQDVVILTLVRSNSKREVGFLKDKRRLNVAMTRAKKQLCVIGDSGTVKHGGQFLRSWMSWLESEGEVVYAGDDS